MSNRFSVNRHVNGKIVAVPLLGSTVIERSKQDPFIVANHQNDVRHVQELFNQIITGAPGYLPFGARIPETGLNNQGYLYQLIQEFQRLNNIQGEERNLTCITPNGDTIRKLAAKARDVQAQKTQQANVRELAQMPQIKAMLDVIAWAEGLGDNYRRLADGIVVSTPNPKYRDFINKHSRQIVISFDEHPQVYIRWKQGEAPTSAAGRYQFLYNTWKQISSRYGITGFTPESQDLAAIGLMMDMKMHIPLSQGNFDEAVQRGCTQWASFPDKNNNMKSHAKNQNAKPISDLRKIYAQSLSKHTK